MDIPGIAVGEITPRDDRIYEDSKGRPVGIAAIINRITNTLEHPQGKPPMTPEDKRILDSLFKCCMDHAEAYLHSHRRSTQKKSPHHGLLSYSSNGDTRQRFEKSPRPLSPYTGLADRNSGSDRYPVRFSPPEPSRQDTRQVSAVCPAVKLPLPARQTPDTH